MNIPGLIIEYLITGVCTLIWLFPIIRDTEILISINKLESYYFVPIIYVLGMVIDGLAFFLVSKKGLKLKDLIIKYQDKETKGIKDFFENTSSTDRELKRIKFHTDVAKEMQARSSRDRIARGAIINSLIAALVLSNYSKFGFISFITGILLALIFSLIWVQFQKLSNKFEYKTWQLINATKSKE